MPLFVQLTDKKGAEVWHVVESYEAVGDGAVASVDFERRYRAGCGLVKEAGADRMAEAEVPPWTNRHVNKGCFATASDPQEG
jgi:hypothetical protein